jgi:hypothetical protein
MDIMRPFRGGWASAAAAATAPPPANASVDVAVVRQRFNWEWCFDSDNGVEQDTSWWWARSIRVDPSEIIADDDEGNLWLVPFTTDGADEVTFGEPVRVRETYVPVAASAGAQATAMVSRAGQRVVASNLERPEKPGRTTAPTTAAVPPDNEGSTTMDETVRVALARQHGLDPDTATEADVNAAVLAAAEQPEPEPQPEPDPAPAAVPAPAGEVPGSEGPQPPTSPDLAAAAAALGLPATATAEEIAATATEVRRGSEAGAAVARSLETQTLDQEVDAAVSDGRIYPSARTAWRTAIDPGENPTAETIARAAAERQSLAALATNRVPVRERGATPDPAQAGDSNSLARALAASGLGNRNTTKGE